MNTESIHEKLQAAIFLLSASEQVFKHLQVSAQKAVKYRSSGIGKEVARPANDAKVEANRLLQDTVFLSVPLLNSLPKR